MQLHHKNLPTWTSFHGSVIKCKASDLRSILGIPRYEGNDGTDKVNFDWVMETESGDVFLSL
jgi:hypothetical protein